MRRIVSSRWGLVLVAWTVGCAPMVSAGRPERTPFGAVTVSRVADARCVRSATGRDRPYREDLPGAVSDPRLATELARFSPEIRRIAQAAGLEPRLAALLRAWRAREGRPSLDGVALRQEVEARLGSLGMQGMAVEFEAECNIALVKQTLEQLDGDEKTQQFALAIASLVVGAASAAGAGAWDLAGTSSDGPLVLGVAGGTASALLAAAGFLPRQRAVVYLHDHNILAPILRGADPDRLYPTFVFRLLTMPSVTAEPNPRDRLLAEWRDLLDASVPPDDRVAAEAILFGGGGVYDAELLALRVRLFESLESTIDGLSRDIDLLNAAVHEALDGSP